MSQEAWDRLAFVLITTIAGATITAVGWFARSILKPYFDSKMEEARAFRKHVEEVGPKLDNMANSMNKIAMAFDSQSATLANISKGTDVQIEKLDEQTEVICSHNAMLHRLVTAFGSDPLRDICRLRDKEAVVAKFKKFMADKGKHMSDAEILEMLATIERREAHAGGRRAGDNPPEDEPAEKEPKKHDKKRKEPEQK